ncbi:hypothetical protein PTTG_05461 [Puccinia triticina 1-1 BBBD Race 1]|uniref:Uncharacterized protein n=1 Tax=Puccinia triticina (isolate 1-1 / race 1 (BBBD)) TaxID=630390 RepID=A0A180GSA5_PUCT1|nr:hypothetical protein PTTG_05461 [Puccinia triticina 1-1 BBBD Race 1]
MDTTKASWGPALHLIEPPPPVDSHSGTPTHTDPKATQTNPEEPNPPGPHPTNTSLPAPLGTAADRSILGIFTEMQRMTLQMQQANFDARQAADQQAQEDRNQLRRLEEAVTHALANTPAKTPPQWPDQPAALPDVRWPYVHRAIPRH